MISNDVKHNFNVEKQKKFKLSSLAAFCFCEFLFYFTAREKFLLRIKFDCKLVYKWDFKATRNTHLGLRLP